MGSFGPVLGTEGGAGGSGFGGPSSAPKDYTGNANLQTTFGMLQNVANGTGPDPAMTQYNQNISNLAQQQAGAISSVQGISPALAARMISQQKSGAMQNAAGQGATTQAQQQLGAMGQMGGIAQQQASIASGLQQNVNNVNAGLANQMGERGQSAAGGGASGAGSAMGTMMGARGGMVRHMAGGGPIGQTADSGSVGPISQFSQFLAQGNPSPTPSPVSVDTNVPSVLQAPKQSYPKGTAKSGAASPGANEGASAGSSSMYTSGGYGNNVMNMNAGPSATSQSYGSDLMNRDSGMSGYAMGGVSGDYRSGGHVKAAAPSQKAVASGNSYANDKVPAMLSEGEIVLPRSVTKSKNPPAAAMRFVQAVMAKKSKGGKRQ